MRKKYLTAELEVLEVRVNNQKSQIQSTNNINADEIDTYTLPY